MQRVRVRCRSCGKELEGHPGKTYSCGCPNMMTVRDNNISARDMSDVVMLNSGNRIERDSLTPGDLQWQEERRKRKVRKLNFEIR
tara:strand:+ start:334 stop:588 length:255 start_codon:yes stop_codon:yes gene_type:complete